MHRYVPPSLTRTTRILTGGIGDVGHLSANGVREADVRDEPFAKKSRYASARAIDKLIRNDEIQWLVLFFKGTNGTER